MDMFIKNAKDLRSININPDSAFDSVVLSPSYGTGLVRDTPMDDFIYLGRTNNKNAARYVLIDSGQHCDLYIIDAEHKEDIIARVKAEIEHFDTDVEVVA